MVLRDKVGVGKVKLPEPVGVTVGGDVMVELGPDVVVVTIVAPVHVWYAMPRLMNLVKLGHCGSRVDMSLCWRGSHSSA